MANTANFRRLAVISVPAFIAVIITLAILDIRTVFEPPLGLFVLNTLFLSVVGFVVAYISARSYLLSGLPSLLFLGCGVLALGVASLVAGLMIDLPDGPNVAVTIYNTGVLFASALHLASAAMTLTGAAPEWVSKYRKLGLMLGYLGVLVFMASLSIVSLQGTIPPFFIQGVGPTLLRQGVLGAAVALFAISSIIFMRYCSKSKSDMLYWYSLGLALITVGLFAVFLQKAVGSPIGWIGRSAQYIGGIYFLVAVLTTIRRASIKTVSLEKVMASFFSEAKEHYRALVETASDAIISCDHENTVLLWNSAAEKVFGYSRGEAIGSLLVDLIAPDQDTYGLRAELENLGRPEKSHLIRQATEVTAKRKDGKVFPIELSGSTRETADGWTSTIMVRDITERKRAEGTIKREKKQAEEYLNIAGVMLAIIDADEKISLINKKGCEILGYKEGELIGKNWFDTLIPQRIRDEIRGVFGKLMAGDIEPVEHYENPLLTKDGEERLIAFHNTVIRDPDGQIAGALLSGEDITKRKRAEEALVDETTRRRILIEQSRDGIVILDQNGKVYEANQQFAKMLGYSPEETAQLHVWDWDTQWTHEQLLEMLGSVDAAGDHFQTYHRRKDGTVYDVEISTNGAIIAGQKLVFCVCRDITERKQAEERERELQQELNLLSRLASVGQMAAGIAHEINNPLTGVVGFSDLLMKKDIPEDIRKDAKIIYDGAQRIASITSRMLTYTRQYKPEQTTVDINDIIKTTLAMRTYELESSNIKVTPQLDPDLPVTMADAGQLQQVFLNIVLNAETEMINAHGRGTLSIKTERIDDAIRISFKDDGPGIPNKNLDRIFEPFFTTREVGKGAGLGLSVSHGIVIRHGGKIYARSRLGKGATFIVELPIVTKEEQLELAEVVAKEPEVVSRGRILVIDDDTIVQQFLTEVLGEEGHEVEIVDNSDDALERLGSEDYDVILLDIKLPGMSGIELYRYMQKAVKSLARRVVFITGDVMNKDTMDFLSSTRAPYITKPFDGEQIKKDVDRILSQHS